MGSTGQLIVDSLVANGIDRVFCVPEGRVICLVGDGGFPMTGNELAVAREREYPGRVIGTSFANPDFELFGRAFGCSVTRIRVPDDLSALPQILARPGLELVVVDTSLEAVLQEH